MKNLVKYISFFIMIFKTLIVEQLSILFDILIYYLPAPSYVYLM